MEILLNLLWLLVAISAFLYWRTGKFRSTPRSRHTTSLGILALVCALILLFPVISLTDDLHAEMAVMEDGSGPVMKARALVHGNGHCEKFSLHALATPFQDSFSIRFDVRSQVISQEIPLHSPTPIRPTQARAPPISQINLA